MRFLLLLVQQAGPRQRPRIRVVAIGELLINSLELDFDAAHLTAATIMLLLETARPVE